MTSLLQRLLPLRYMYFHPKYQRFIAEYREFARLSEDYPKRFPLRWKDHAPFLDDRLGYTPFPPDYTYFPAWAARVLANLRPARHVDIASSIHFCTIVSAFVPIDYFEYRPAHLTLTNLTSERADLTRLPFPTGSVESISCMHVVEHVGLGRYGDPLDPIGDLRAIKELARVLARGGSLLFVVPVGEPRVAFNAHRVYSYDQIAESFPGLRIEQFALVDDRGGFVVDADPSKVLDQQYGCGCWWFRK